MKLTKKYIQSSKLALALSAALVLTLAGASLVEAKSLYVSKAGNNADGLTWQSAWNELDQIDWNKVEVNDEIFIDGGAYGGSMTYRKPLIIGKGIPPQSGGLIIISQGQGLEHGGVAVINGLNKTNFCGIQAIGKRGFVFRSYGRRGWLKVTNCTTGVYTKDGSQNYFQGLEIANCGVGAHLEGDSVALVQANIHDNIKNVEIHSPGASVGTQSPSGLYACWIYNGPQAVPPGNAAGITVTAGAVPPVSGNPSGNAVINNCVLGPNLMQGVDNGFPGLKINGCLFLNAYSSSLTLRNSTELDRCTLFVTARNSLGNPKTAIRVLAGNNSIRNSIIYGGVVRIPQGLSYGPKNTQFATTGNTSALSAGLVDPLFVSPVGTYQEPVSFAVLKNANFALKPGSPAQGTGAQVTSVQAVLNQLQ